MTKKPGRLTVQTLCSAVVAVMVAVPCRAEEPAELLKKLGERRAKIRSLHHITADTAQAKDSTTKVTTDLWEKRDGDLLKQRLFRETVKTSAGSDKPAGSPTRGLTVSDGKIEWRELPVGDGVMAVKSKPKPRDDLRELRSGIEGGRARSKDGGTIAGHECVLIEVVGGSDSARFKTSYWVSSKYGIILKRTHASAGGDRRELTTVELKINESVDDAKFTYTPPAGATVLDTDAMKPPAKAKGKGK